MLPCGNFFFPLGIWNRIVFVCHRGEQHTAQLHDLPADTFYDFTRCDFPLAKEFACASTSHTCYVCSRFCLPGFYPLRFLSEVPGKSALLCFSKHLFNHW